MLCIVNNDVSSPSNFWVPILISKHELKEKNENKQNHLSLSLTTKIEALFYFSGQKTKNFHSKETLYEQGKSYYILIVVGILL